MVLHQIKVMVPKLQDEVIYYVDGDFMSRNNVDEGYISLHEGYPLKFFYVVHSET